MAIPYSGELPKTGARLSVFSSTLQTRIIVKIPIRAATALPILTYVIVILNTYTLII